jgi:cytochrome c oxidase subunit 4
MQIQENKSTLVVAPRDNEKIIKIWKTAGILLAITVVEFIMAFTMDRVRTGADKGNPTV